MTLLKLLPWPTMRRAQKEADRSRLYSSATSGPDEQRQNRVLALMEEKKRWTHLSVLPLDI